MQQIGTMLIPYRMLMLLGIAISIFGCLAIVFVASMKRIIGGMQERKTLLSEEEILKTNWGDASLLDKNKAMRQVVAPNGVDPNINSYLILNDGGKDVYVDLCQYFEHKKLKGYADFFNSSSSFCCGVI